jgi:hypothetical protein
MEANKSYFDGLEQALKNNSRITRKMMEEGINKSLTLEEFENNIIGSVSYN